MWIVHFLGRAAGEVAAPGVGFEQDLVGEHVELLLRLALHVATAGFAEDTAEVAFADRDRDGLAGTRDDFDEQTQVGIDVLMSALFLDEEARQGNRSVR